MSGLSMVLLGNSAVGKSSSGNTILGRPAFKSRSSLKPVTTAICESAETVHGRLLSVVDTPGILINPDALQSIRQHCEQLLHSPGPTVFLVVLKVDRVSSEQVQALEKIMEVLGDEGMKRSLLLFTYGAALEGRPLEDFIYEDDEGPLPDIYSMFRQRHHVFDNVAWGQEQVQQLLDKIDQIQTEVSAGCELEAHEPPPPVEQRRLVLPGARKNSSGNSIQGQSEFESRSFLKLVNTRRFSMSDLSANLPGHSAVRKSSSEKSTQERLDFKSRSSLKSVTSRTFSMFGLSASLVGKSSSEKPMQGRLDFKLRSSLKAVTTRNLLVISLGNSAVRKSSSERSMVELDNFESRSSLKPLSTGISSNAAALEPAPYHLEQLRLVLLGLPGAGKSSSGNSILGSDQFKSSCAFNAVSTEAECKSAAVLGRQVSVVDTPGFSDEGLTPRKLFKRIMKSVLHLTEGPHAFIIVVRVGRIGMRREAKLLELIPRLFDKVASKFTMVLFTHGDNLGGEKIEKLIEENPTMKSLVAKCNERYMVFDNKNKANIQIEQLFKMIDAMVQASGVDYCMSRIFKLTKKSEIKEFLEKLWKEIQYSFTDIIHMRQTEEETATSYEVLTNEYRA